MASFCSQCSIDVFGEDFGDMKNLIKGPLGDDEAIPVLCEDCGHTMVDLDGKCVASDCLKKGHT